MLACNNNCAVNLVLGDRSVEAGIVSTGDMLAFKEVDLGTIEITESGEQILQIRPAGESWSGLNLQVIYLQKNNRDKFHLNKKKQPADLIFSEWQKTIHIAYKSVKSSGNYARRTEDFIYLAQR